ncbi:MAG TPA: ATP-binding protein, partial [Flavisolibacter sp.]|nr:ATP-binding protein [Flavisolibacter sp.]
RFNTIFGFSRSVSREQFAGVIHKDDLPIREAAHRDAVHSGNLFYEARVIWSDHSEHWIRVKGGILFDEHKNPVKLIGVVQDITEQKRFAEQLERQVRERTAELERKNGELEQYAHVTSHDLQEPLRKIRVFADMIREADYDKLSESSRLRFSKIEDAVKRMSSFLRDLLNFTMLNREDQLEEVDLNQIVEAVLTDLELIIAQKKAVVQLDTLPVLRAIRIQMQQLFYNLINNALKFSRPEVAPVIEITAGMITESERNQGFHLDPHLEYSRIVIRDNGIGFDPDSSGKIFGMFQRLHSRMEYSGTGIGLALCKKVVMNHMGALYAQSEPGKGSAFIILLPVNSMEQ